jgi:Uma2 family endonuclease
LSKRIATKTASDEDRDKDGTRPLADQLQQMILGGYNRRSRSDPDNCTVVLGRRLIGRMKLMNPVALSPKPRRLPRSGAGEPPWEIAVLFPAQGQWTEAEYLALQRRSNLLVELSDGYIEVLPMPSPFHQRVVRFLFRLLETYVLGLGTGEVFFAPLPIRLKPGKFRDPDVVYLRPGRIADPHHQPHGADLAIEVVSDDPEDRQRDLETKREEYAAAGIAEYWIVDPREHQILVLTLDGETYRVHGEFGRGATATSRLLPGFSVSVDAVVAAGDGDR